MRSAVNRRSRREGQPRTQECFANVVDCFACGRAHAVADLAVTDFGQTIRLGRQEAATDAILYEFDGEYRRRAKRRQPEAARSLGGALRRLRLQKGLRQSDFPGLTAKEIARIERGEVKKPHQRTLAAIAKRIGVPAEEI